MEFKDAFQDFLEAVARHDWEATERYLDKQLPLNILLPGRLPIRTYDEFVDSQRKFFANPKSYFDYKIVQTEQSGDLGFGVSQNCVKLDPNEEKFTTLQVCFLFRLVNGSWKLIFDQNTVLPE